MLDSSERLNNEVRAAGFLSIILEMPSGPEAVFVLYVDRSLDTSSTEQVILEREQSRGLEVSEEEKGKEEG